MTEVSLEEIISEEEFAPLLASQGEMFFRLASTLLERPSEQWARRHLLQLINEADDLESYLDDFGARYNRTYNDFRELVASVRGFAQAGFSVLHLGRRLESYRAGLSLSSKEQQQSRASIRLACETIIGILFELLAACRAEASRLGVTVAEKDFPIDRYSENPTRKLLPRNVDLEDPQDEDQKIAEVASKYLQACDMLAQIQVHAIEDAAEREAYLRRSCSEEQARVYEATVHNLQSAYDTYIKNTLIEARDERVSRLRGHISAALHFLEAVTHLVHFVERHESGARHETSEKLLRDVVDRETVRAITLNHLLCWADRFMQSGRALAEDMLPSYTTVQELAVHLPKDTVLHARPASLIVGIVNHYGTPVEMEVEGSACNAGSILELMVSVGSNPDAKDFLFRGDQYPLKDIALLFQHGLGEKGLDELPDELDYLRS